MKICITAQQDNLTSKVDPRFEKCSYFVVIDPETLGFDFIENPDITSIGGLGVEAANMMVESEVKVVLTGSIGSEVFAILRDAGIKFITTLSRNDVVEDVVKRFNMGELIPTATPDISDIGEEVALRDFKEHGMEGADSYRRGKEVDAHSSGEPGGQCVCPNCGYVMVHQAELSCEVGECPECGEQMVRA